MEGKRSKKEMDEALDSRTRKKTNVNKSTKNVIPAAGFPLSVVFSMSQPPTSPGEDRASYADGENHEGGIAFLGLKV